MKKHILTLCLFLLISGILAGQNNTVIPAPLVFVQNTGYFSIASGCKVSAPAAFKREMHFLQTELLRYKHLTTTFAASEKEAVIILSNKASKNFLYELQILKNKVIITSGTDTGIFYGIISFLQLVNNASSLQQIPCATIKDSPSMPWRGIMRDESRHFFGVEKVKSILDWMAYYKLNKFHWHLTDEPGWRIEIKQYPNLTNIGGIGNFSDKNAEARYYTQQDINEIVQYAHDRKIEVIPEIDMPGHASAANRAYPEFSGGGSEKHPDFTFHPTKETTYQYLTNILKEINVLFPDRMLHLGGDEVSFGIDKWKTDPAVLELMQKKNMNDIKGVETYFIERMADSLAAMNAKILVWDEMVTANLPLDKTIIFWWRHDKPEQLKLSLQKGYKTVVCPRIPYYFDFVQKEDHKVGRKWGGKFSDLQSIYNFSLKELQPDAKSRSSILGVQGNIWTETIQTNDRLDFMLFPRIAALAESAWTPEEGRNFDRFMERLKLHTILYEAEKLYYFNPFDAGVHGEPAN